MPSEMAAEMVAWMLAALREAQWSHPSPTRLASGVPSVMSPKLGAACHTSGRYRSAQLADTRRRKRRL